MARFHSQATSSWPTYECDPKSDEIMQQKAVLAAGLDRMTRGFDPNQGNSKHKCPNLPGIAQMYGMSFPQLCLFTGLVPNGHQRKNVINIAKKATANNKSRYYTELPRVLQEDKTINFRADLLSGDWASMLKTMSYYHDHSIPSDIENLLCEIFRDQQKGDAFFFLQDRYLMYDSQLTVVPFDTDGHTEEFDTFRNRQRIERRRAGTEWFDMECNKYGSISRQ
jgi:hypothetical protein